MDVEETDFDLKDWNLKSSMDNKISYKLRSFEPIEYFDFRIRFLMKTQKENFLGYCVQFNTASG